MAKLSLQNGKWISDNGNQRMFEVEDGISYYKNIALFDHPSTRNCFQLKEKWIIGSFGTAPKIIQEVSSIKFLNIKLSNIYGVLMEDCKTIYTIPYHGVGVEKLYWVSDSKFQEILGSRQSWNNPLTSYKIQPQIQGKTIIISGSPGTGKSSSAYILAKNHGFVYFEGDCFMHLLNPYIPLDTKNPTMQHVSQPNLKNYPLETVKATRAFHLMIKQSLEPTEEISEAYYEALAKHVKLERERIGGPDWVVSQAIPSRKHRNVIRNILGPKCIFITLSLSSETRKLRLFKRYQHLDEEKRSEILNFRARVEKNFEPAALDEENAHNIFVTPELNQEAVVKNIREIYTTY